MFRSAAGRPAGKRTGNAREEQAFGVASTNHFCSFSLGKMNQNRPLCKNYRFAQIFASRGGSPIRNLAFALRKLLSRNPLYRPTGVGDGGAGLFYTNCLCRPNSEDVIEMLPPQCRTNTKCGEISRHGERGEVSGGLAVVRLMRSTCGF